MVAYDNMKKLLLISVLFLAAIAAPAQPFPTEDAQTIELREKLGIDYSMPDFSTSKVDGDIIGIRLSKNAQRAPWQSERPYL
jgi:hypothetical protein